MTNVGVSGTTQYQAMVKEAIHRMVDVPPYLDLCEVARGAGVPQEVALQLFPDRVALVTAAAENALVRLFDHLGTRGAQVGDNDPVAQYKAISLGYLEWCIAHPRAFEVLNSLHIFKQSNSGNSARYNRAIRELMTSILLRAREAGRLSPGADIEETLFRTRALVNGMATLVVHRLAVHWTDADDAAEAAVQNVESYLDSLFLPESPDQTIRSEE